MDSKIGIIAVKTGRGHWIKTKTHKFLTQSGEEKSVEEQSLHVSQMEELIEPARAMARDAMLELLSEESDPEDKIKYAMAQIKELLEYLVALEQSRFSMEVKTYRGWEKVAVEELTLE